MLERAILDDAGGDRGKVSRVGGPPSMMDRCGPAPTDARKPHEVRASPAGAPAATCVRLSAHRNSAVRAPASKRAHVSRAQDDMLIREDAAYDHLLCPAAAADEPPELKPVLGDDLSSACSVSSEGRLPHPGLVGLDEACAEAHGGAPPPCHHAASPKAVVDAAELAQLAPAADVSALHQLLPPSANAPELSLEAAELSAEVELAPEAHFSVDELDHADGPATAVLGPPVAPVPAPASAGAFATRPAPATDRWLAAALNSADGGVGLGSTLGPPPGPPPGAGLASGLSASLASPVLDLFQPPSHAEPRLGDSSPPRGSVRPPPAVTPPPPRIPAAPPVTASSQILAGSLAALRQGLASLPPSAAEMAAQLGSAAVGAAASPMLMRGCGHGGVSADPSLPFYVGAPMSAVPQGATGATDLSRHDLSAALSPLHGGMSGVVSGGGGSTAAALAAAFGHTPSAGPVDSHAADGRAHGGGAFDGKGGSTAAALLQRATEGTPLAGVNARTLNALQQELNILSQLSSSLPSTHCLAGPPMPARVTSSQVGAQHGSAHGSAAMRKQGLGGGMAPSCAMELELAGVEHACLPGEEVSGGGASPSSFGAASFGDAGSHGMLSPNSQLASSWASAYGGAPGAAGLSRGAASLGGYSNHALGNGNGFGGSLGIDTRSGLSGGLSNGISHGFAPAPASTLLSAAQSAAVAAKIGDSNLGSSLASRIFRTSPAPIDQTPRIRGLAHEAAAAANAAAAAALAAGGRTARHQTDGKETANHAAAAAAEAASRLMHAAPAACSRAKGHSKTFAINRKSWSMEEDATIRACVASMGMRWRLIAPHLPGRSDDSVRNRWKRLREEDGEDVPDGASASAAAPSGGASRWGGGVPPTDGRHGGANRNSGATRSVSTRYAAGGVGGGRSVSQRRDDEEYGGEDEDDKGGRSGAERQPRVSWSAHEDEVIVRAVRELGPRWCAVASRLPSRTDQAIRNRWNRLQQRARVQARTQGLATQQAIAQAQLDGAQQMAGLMLPGGLAGLAGL